LQLGTEKGKTYRSTSGGMAGPVTIECIPRATQPQFSRQNVHKEGRVRILTAQEGGETGGRTITGNKWNSATKRSVHGEWDEVKKREYGGRRQGVPGNESKPGDDPGERWKSRKISPTWGPMKAYKRRKERWAKKKDGMGAIGGSVNVLKQERKPEANERVEGGVEIALLGEERRRS